MPKVVLLHTERYTLAGTGTTDSINSGLTLVPTYKLKKKVKKGLNDFFYISVLLLLLANNSH
jgi:hypothetical protein